MIEYSAGDPQYVKQPDTRKYADGENGSYIPMYQVDFGSLRWDRDKMEKALNPAAYGATFLKQALWLGDFLGNMHTVDQDEEREPDSSTADKDGKLKLGVSSADGFQGMILTEEVWNKLAFIRENLFYDGKADRLTSSTGAKYNPASGFVYLPHKIEVVENGADGFYKAASLRVTDAYQRGWKQTVCGQLSLEYCICDRCSPRSHH